MGPPFFGNPQLYFEACKESASPAGRVHQEETGSLKLVTVKI